MQELVQQHIEEIMQLCQKYDVATLHVFGSVTTDSFNASSDVDVLISFKDISFEKYTDNYFDLHLALESLLGRKVDLITDKSLSNPFFISEIEKTKKLLYAA
ncbi:MAG: nucleotidyltransferase domain-containing protein [Fluviicola sp.]|nr:nucleotidyltransferase domain-containing protein [Fluviicola sp.]